MELTWAFGAELLKCRNEQPVKASARKTKHAKHASRLGILMAFRDELRVWFMEWRDDEMKLKAASCSGFLSDFIWAQRSVKKFSGNARRLQFRFRIFNFLRD